MLLLLHHVAIAYTLLLPRTEIAPQRSTLITLNENIPKYNPNIEKELQKLKTRRRRITTSAPARFFDRSLHRLLHKAEQSNKLYRDLLQILPFHYAMLIFTSMAFAVQKGCGDVALMAGARINSLIDAGQWHRLVTPIFLHGSISHLFSNCYSLWQIGPIVSQNFGSERALLLYLTSGIGGNLLGYWFGNARGMSVGASGSVFGLMGCVFAFARVNKNELGYAGSSIQQQLTRVLVINLMFGLQRGSGVDNLAHVGGFVSGAILGLLLSPRRGGGRDGFIPMPLIRVSTWLSVLVTASSVGQAWHLGSMLVRRGGAAARLLR